MSRQRSTPRKVKGQARKIKPLAELKIIHPHAAGLDIGSRETWACVPASRVVPNPCARSVRSRLTCTRWPIG
jgi:hypothetical protein